jgi:hypothetical protein
MRAALQGVFLAFVLFAAAFGISLGWELGKQIAGVMK